ncbi:MAG: helix-turn-helix transcriptional regulator [Alphaproteobacteria bacterium]|nr:helix-turn-helix transcriptional regulator [Alphaproteobacteria bacterium]
MMKTVQELMIDIAGKAKARRLAMNLTQEGLALRSGVSFGTIKLFERSGKISLESLLKIAIALGSSEEFETLFSTPQAIPRSLEEILSQPKVRKRGSIK